MGCPNNSIISNKYQTPCNLRCIQRKKNAIKKWKVYNSRQFKCIASYNPINGFTAYLKACYFYI